VFVTAHAHNRLAARIGGRASDALVSVLETHNGEQGTVAYILGTLPGKAKAADGSNGDVVVAVAVEGSVETVYYRRSTQDLSPEFFGARKVTDLRATPVYATTCTTCGMLPGLHRAGGACPLTRRTLHAGA
jgi:uncharacterized protein with NRDE domain